MNLMICQAELQRRELKLMKELESRKADAICLFGSTEVFYLSNFAFIPTERPMSLIITASGRRVLFVPRLEHEHAEEHAFIHNVVSYPEYPTDHHPMKRLAELLTEMGLAKANIAVDSDGYGSPWGYHGPRLSQLLPEAKIIPAKEIIETMRMIKSEEELVLIRESCRWGNLAHVLLQEYSKPRISEMEISMRASMEATMTMVKTLGPSYHAAGGHGASAGFRGQIGPNSALPHAVTINARLQPGDTLVTGAGASIFGYNSELERTMFVGEPSAEQKRYFELMEQAQEIAFAAIRPGRPCSEVDEEVTRFYRENDLMHLWRHHTGHALGMLGHEAPFFDTGDKTIMQPGMVFSIEPGLYVMGLGGFRHSDTIVVTESGMEMLTYYPRGWQNLICG